jgi:hypothetical protein
MQSLPTPPHALLWSLWPATHLQVATRSTVALFDLMALCQTQPEALTACLGPLMASAAVLKLGVEVSGDLAKLAGSWPGVSGWQHVHSVLDLRPLWVAYGQAAKLQVRAAYMALCLRHLAEHFVIWLAAHAS